MKLRSLKTNTNGVIRILITFMVLAIIAVAVVLPVIQETIGGSGLGGLPLTIVSFLSVLVACGVLYWFGFGISG